jgi:hypothetical protein
MIVEHPCRVAKSALRKFAARVPSTKDCVGDTVGGRHWSVVMLSGDSLTNW